MTAGATYSPIATVTLGSATSVYTFSSIPNTYTDLVLVVSTNAGISNLNLRFNSDSSNLYSDTIIYNNGTSVVSARDQTQNVIYGTVTSGTPFQLWNIMSYASTAVYKTVFVRNNDGSGLGGYSNTASATIGMYRSFSAINAVNLVAGSGNIPAGTIATLYGIAAA